MTDKIKIIVGILLALVIGFALGRVIPSGIGGTTNFDGIELSEGLTVAGDGTISGGKLTVTTANTATSTATIGCVQTYATSTATAVRMVIGSIATSSTSYGGTNTVGLVGWQYGTCPNL